MLLSVNKEKWATVPLLVVKTNLNVSINLQNVIKAHFLLEKNKKQKDTVEITA